MCCDGICCPSSNAGAHYSAAWRFARSDQCNPFPCFLKIDCYIQKAKCLRYYVTFCSTSHINCAWYNSSPKAKSLAKISTPRREIPDLKDPSTGELATTDCAKAKILGSVFSTETTYQRHARAQLSYVGALFPLPQHHPSKFQEIGEQSVFHHAILQRLSPFKSTGDMVITNRLLTETAPVISTSLSLFSTCRSKQQSSHRSGNAQRSHSSSKPRWSIQPL